MDQAIGENRAIAPPQKTAIAEYSRPALFELYLP